MARGINIPFTLNPREFVRGLKVIGDGLDDVVDDFRDLERAGDRSADNLNRTWDRAGDRIEDSFKGVADRAEAEFDQLERQARTSGRNMDRNLSREVRGGSFRGAAGALAAEAGQELVESWGEAIREGNPAGVVREVFSNAALIGAAAGGPIGAAAGFAVSAFVVPLIDRLEKQRQNVAAAVSSLFEQVTGDSELSGREAGEAFARGYVDAASIPGQVQQALGLDTVLDAAAEVDRIARETGLSYGTVQDAILGNRDALAQVQAQLDTNNSLYDRNLDQIGALKDVDNERVEGLRDQQDALNDQKAELGKLLGLGGAIADKNAENARLSAVMAGAQQQAALGAKGTRDYLNQVRVPQVGPLASGLASASGSASNLAAQMRSAADAAARARWEVNGIPRSVTVNVINKVSRMPI